VHVTDATFEAEVLNYELPVLIDFWAEWCGPCRMVAPTLEKLAKEYAGKVRIAKVNVDENPGLSQAFRIMSIPTIMLIKQRTVVFSQPGALPEAAFRDLLNQLIVLELPPRDEEAEEESEAVEQ
jgi:thioredoxin 1